MHATGFFFSCLAGLTGMGQGPSALGAGTAPADPMTPLLGKSLGLARTGSAVSPRPTRRDQQTRLPSAHYNDVGYLIGSGLAIYPSRQDSSRLPSSPGQLTAPVRLSPSRELPAGLCPSIAGSYCSLAPAPCLSTVWSDLCRACCKVNINNTHTHPQTTSLRPRPAAGWTGTDWTQRLARDPRTSM